MSKLDSIVKFTINLNSPGVPREGFGIPLILSHSAPFGPLTKLYGQYSDAVPGDFTADSPEALSIASALDQSPHPTGVLVGKASTSVTLIYALAAAAVTANRQYAVNVIGKGVTETECSYTTGTSKSLDLSTKTTHMNTVVEATGTFPTPTLQFVADAVSEAGTITDVSGVVTVHFDPTVTLPTDVEALLATATSIRIRSHNTLSNTALTTPADVFAATPLAVATVSNDEIVSNLVVLLNAVVDKNYTATLTGAAGSQTILVTASAPNNWFALQMLDPTSLSTKMTHADPGIGADLAAILKQNNTWYELHILFPSKLYAMGAAAFVEANGKIMLFDVPDTDALSTDIGNGDTLDVWFGHGYKRSFGQYHSIPGEMMSIGLAGGLLPLNPGSWTAAFKEISGSTPDNLDDDQIAHLEERRANYYTTIGLPTTLNGTVANADWGYLDIVVASDWFTNLVQTNTFGVLRGKPKIGMTDQDISLLKGAAQSAVNQAISDDFKVLAPGTPGSSTDPVPVVFFPKVQDIPAATRALRKIPNATITGRFQGAVQEVDFIANLSF